MPVLAAVFLCLVVGFESCLFAPVEREDDASPEHASSGDVGASAAAPDEPPGAPHRTPQYAAPSSQREQARNTD